MCNKNIATKQSAHRFPKSFQKKSIYVTKNQLHPFTIYLNNPSLNLTKINNEIRVIYGWAIKKDAHYS